MRRELVRSRRQTVDKTNELRQFDKSFGQAFSQACADPTRARWSLAAASEIPYTAFSLVNFSFAPAVSKEKWLTDLCNLTNCALYAYVY